MGKMVDLAGHQWDGSGLVTSKNQTGKVFLMGCVEYPKVDGSGIATVVFTAQTAFFFYDEGDDVLWNMHELSSQYKSGELNGQFPEDYNESYMPIMTAGYDAEDKDDFVSEPDMDMIARFGLDKTAADDIVARMKSLAGFRVETDIING